MLQYHLWQSRDIMCNVLKQHHIVPVSKDLINPSKFFKKEIFVTIVFIKILQPAS